MWNFKLFVPITPLRIGGVKVEEYYIHGSSYLCTRSILRVVSKNLSGHKQFDFKVEGYKRLKFCLSRPVLDVIKIYFILYHLSWSWSIICSLIYRSSILILIKDFKHKVNTYKLVIQRLTPHSKKF